MMNKCQVCKQREGSKSSVIADTYYPAICDICYDRLLTGQTTSSGHADWMRGRDFEEHEADTRQPFNNGKLDSTFAKLYPDTARKIASQDEINEALRS
jgi:hypothetical protein